MKDRDTKQIGVPAKYQDVTERLCKDLKADAVILMVINGRKGTGMCVSTNEKGAVFGHPAMLAEFFRLNASVIESGSGPEGVAETTFKPTGEG